MTQDILDWLNLIVKPMTANAKCVAEIGALNVNGSARDVLQGPGMEWTGIDRSPGQCVDVVTAAAEWLNERPEQFDLIVACETFEHDPRFWETNTAARMAIAAGGLYVVTTPTIGFPFHDYGGDYFRFTEMAFREVFFNGWGPCELVRVGLYPNECICGVARKPYNKTGETLIAGAVRQCE